jgi:hypothetical protein
VPALLYVTVEVMGDRPATKPLSTTSTRADDVTDDEVPKEVNKDEDAFFQHAGSQ